ncbi:MAG TPA: hypothetical protein VFJ94_05360 [Intrasporangium sp.]|uniref:hypothetical protein n=1 Tax=Intrasporangium sp. TaxID=1925024 RepID=UPI002D79FC67|nr:hypothetical protein [Intrasporangium sp.]HET7397932.1 hypothetical protein [Intrasporangium sp.]
MSQRHGGWFCVDIAKSRELGARHAADRAKGTFPDVSSPHVEMTKGAYSGSALPATVAATTTASTTAGGDGINGWCNATGCWYFWNTDSPLYIHSEFDAVGSYGSCDINGCVGIGTQQIHIGLFTIVDYLTGGSTFVKVQNQHSTKDAATKGNIWYDSNLLVNSTYPSGTKCGTSAQSAALDKAAGTTMSWDGLVLNQCAYQTQATFHEVFWRDYNYPGRWYYFAKSAKFTHEIGYQSHYQGDWDTPSGPLTPAGGGWQNI